MYDLDNIEGSPLGGFFEVFCLSIMLAFHCPISSEVSSLVAGIFNVSTRLKEFCQDLLVPCYLFIAVILLSSWIDCLETGSLVPAYCYRRLVTKKVS